MDNVKNTVLSHVDKCYVSDKFIDDSKRSLVHKQHYVQRGLVSSDNEMYADFMKAAYY